MMDKKFALCMAGGILLVVASTMGEDGPVTRLAGMDAEDARQGQQILRERAGAAPAAPAANSAASADWYAPDPGPVQPAIPVYRYENVEVHVPQEVFDPAVAAASEIR
ncbi:MAG: hypothetical protein OSA41_01440 [Erythrobacter sp.]|jgi:hypothetical protein|uniref:hypothetical protein n=1 Tax=Qipengyuania citrea TaxID=225971 RepID=UPI00209D5F80|nr:hypothetical protein [Qipengyuania citrea]MCP2016295.1 hypothetical protein [Qipengyuania citrea]MDE0900363.1 hypothetical protein [Erythrobacter sp.]